MKANKKAGVIIVVGLLIVAFAAGYIVTAADAGSSDDPLISLSYLTGIFKPEIMTEVDEKVSTLVEEKVAAEIGNQSQGGTSQPLTYVPIQVLAGKSVVCGEGTELILRSGEALSVCPGENGLVDATAGIDLMGGLAVAQNHVYIIPRADGRGIYMSTDGYVMIKGSYTLS